MAEITMCDNKECKRRMSCYRVMADVGNYQGWALFDPDNTGDCDEYVEHKPPMTEEERLSAF